MLSLQHKKLSLAACALLLGTCIWAHLQTSLPSSGAAQQHERVKSAVRRATVDSGDVFDYIVVGSGPGGAVTAAGLATRGFRVLLLEAGDDNFENNTAQQVPRFWPSAVEDPTSALNYVVQLSATRTSVLYPRTQGLGGGSLTSNLIASPVFSSYDFSNIAQITGDSSWSTSALRKLWRTSSNTSYSPLFGNPCDHGYTGWHDFSMADPSTPLYGKDPVADIPVHAMHNLGYPPINAQLDPNCASAIDKEGLHVMVKSTRNGKRVSARDLIKKTQSKFPDTFVVQVNTLVTKIVFQSGVAVGVVARVGKNLLATSPGYQSNASFTTVTYTARYETIISAGAFETPKLLMLSGVGDSAVLQPLGIPVVADLKGVGKNLQDHYEISVVERVSRNFTDLCRTDPAFCLIQWSVSGDKALYSETGPSMAIKYKSGFTTATSVPDMLMYTSPMQLGGFFPGWSLAENLRSLLDRYSLMTLKAYTQNKAGTVTVATTDPTVQPVVNFNQFQEGASQDIPALVAAVKKMRALASAVDQQSLREGLTSSLFAAELKPGSSVTTDVDIETYIRNNAWGSHACCTAKIGAAGDATAVLNSRFSVNGVKNLRVVDASIFPNIPAYFIDAPLYAVAEKAAATIAEGSDDACKNSPNCVYSAGLNTTIILVIVVLVMIVLILLVLYYFTKIRTTTYVRLEEVNLYQEVERRLVGAGDSAASARSHGPGLDSSTDAEAPSTVASTTTAESSFGAMDLDEPSTMYRSEPMLLGGSSGDKAGKIDSMALAATRKSADWDDLEYALFQNASKEKGLEKMNFDTFYAMLKAGQMTTHISEEDARAMFHEMDGDGGDGTITFDEWMAIRGKYRSAQRGGNIPSLDMSFENLDCIYEMKNAPPKQVLFDLTGYIPAGSFVALMGPSGAGKSTLLDILAMRKTTGTITGSILVAGHPRRVDFLRQVAYVTQEDLFLPHMTVLECIMYYANLRLPKGMTIEEKTDLCTSIVGQMGLTNQLHRTVGGPLPGGTMVRGLSGGQKRRLSMACALVANPGILFLDEPTSGLDSFSALTVMETMRSLSRSGITIICTIHQPRTTIWRLFDQLLLTAMGRLMYLGPAQQAVSWFESLGYVCEAGSNPADWIIDLVTTDFEKSADVFGEKTIRNTADIEVASEAFRSSEGYKRSLLDRHWYSFNRAMVHRAVDIVRQESADGTEVKNERLQTSAANVYATSFIDQYLVLLNRSYKSCVRNPGNALSRFFLVITSGVLTGATCFYLDNTLPNVVTRSGVLFLLATSYVLQPFTSLSLFIYDRQFYSKEVAAKLYAPLPYFLANVTVDTIFSSIISALSGAIAFHMINLGNDFADRGQQAGVFIGIVILLYITGGTWVQLCGLVMPNQDTAFSLGAAYVILAQLFAGFLITAPNYTWLGFVQWINFLKYGWLALMHNEFDSLDANMDARLSVLESVSVNPPSSIGVCAAALIGFWLFFLVVGFFALTFLHREQR